MSPLEVGPIYAPGAGPPHPAVLRRQAALQAQPAPMAPPAWVAQPAPVAPPATEVPPAPVAPPTLPAPPTSVAPPTFPAQPAPLAGEHRRFDWVLGVVIGIVLGLAVAAGFVFIGSEDTVDAPRIHGIDGGGPGQQTGAPQAEPEKLPAE